MADIPCKHFSKKNMELQLESVPPWQGVASERNGVPSRSSPNWQVNDCRQVKRKKIKGMSV